MSNNTVIKTTRSILADKVRDASMAMALKTFHQWGSNEGPGRTMGVAMGALAGQAVATGDSFTEKEKAGFIHQGIQSAIDGYFV